MVSAGHSSQRLVPILHDVICRQSKSVHSNVKAMELMGCKVMERNFFKGKKLVEGKGTYGRLGNGTRKARELIEGKGTYGGQGNLWKAREGIL